MPPITSGPVALAIAGFDPSSGAGVTADIKTMAAYGVYGVSCVTALTVQSTNGVTEVHSTEPHVVHSTLETLASDLPIRSVKLGMLGTAEVAQAVSDFLVLHRLGPIVIDPVLSSSSGAALLNSQGWKVMLEKVIGLADVFTPNIDEASWLSGIPVHDVDSAIQAGTRLLHYGASNVVVKGGHLPRPADVLIRPNQDPLVLDPGEKIETTSTHGTGCTFSTAVMCELLKGSALPDAVRGAKHFVTEALRAAHPLGKGNGPLEHFWKQC